MKSIQESENYHALHSRLYDGMHWFFSSRNILIMVCRSGRHRSVASAELWSNTLTRCGRRQHFVSFLHVSELDFWRNTSVQKLFGMQQTVTQSFSSTQVQAEWLRRVLVPDPVTGRWKRPRNMRKAPHNQATLAERSVGGETVDELAERLGTTSPVRQISE